MRNPGNLIDSRAETPSQARCIYINTAWVLELEKDKMPTIE